MMSNDNIQLQQRSKEQVPNCHNAHSLATGSGNHFSAERNDLASSKLKAGLVRKPKRCKGKSRKGFPKRPLSAYNIFFHQEQLRMLNETRDDHSDREQVFGTSNRGVGIAALARMVASRWKVLTDTDRLYYNQEAQNEQLRYNEEVALWHEQRLRKDAAAPLLPLCGIDSNSCQESKRSSSPATYAELNQNTDDFGTLDQQGRVFSVPNVTQSTTLAQQPRTALLPACFVSDWLVQQQKSHATESPHQAHAIIEDWSDVRLFPPGGRVQHFGQPNSTQLFSELDDEEKKILLTWREDDTDEGRH